MKKLSALVKGKKRIGISGHIRPDGDCVGSCLALYHYLKKIVPDAFIDVNLEEPPAYLMHMAGVEDIKSDFKSRGKYDIYFALDVSTLDRLGLAVDYYHNADVTVCIDHHVSNDGSFAEHTQILPDASSTAEVLYDLFAEDKPKEIDEATAICLYTGIIHDSGVLQYSCTSPHTMEIAAKLISFGFNFSKIISESFYEKTYRQNLLLGRALLGSMLFMDGKGIVSVVTRKMMDFYGTTSADLEGIVNQLNNTKGVHFALFMHETDTLTYKVSMRSDETLDVAKVCSSLGGGGHARAAGVTLKGTHHDVINMISAEVAKQLQ